MRGGQVERERRPAAAERGDGRGPVWRSVAVPPGPATMLSTLGPSVRIVPPFRVRAPVAVRVSVGAATVPFSRSAEASVSTMPFAADKSPIAPIDAAPDCPRSIAPADDPFRLPVVSDPLV